MTYEEALKELAYEPKPYQNSPIETELIQMTRAFGFSPYHEVPHFIVHESQPGLIVQRDQSQFNNGIYVAFNDQGALKLQVLVPNTNSREPLIQKIIAILDNAIAAQPTEDLDIFDWVSVFSYVIDNSLLSPLAETFFPDDPLKQDYFKNL